MALIPDPLKSLTNTGNFNYYNIANISIYMTLYYIFILFEKFNVSIILTVLSLKILVNSQIIKVEAM